MKREVLLLALTLALFEVAAGSRAIARSAREAGAPPAAVQASMDVRQAYPLMTVRTTQPLQIPGRVLAPGEYVFRLINSDEEVEIMRADGAESYGTFRVMPAYTRNPGDGRVVTQEDSDGGPDRLDSWYFPAQQDGYALAYPAD